MNVLKFFSDIGDDRDNSVYIVIKLALQVRGVVARFPADPMDLSLSESVQTDCEAHS